MSKNQKIADSPSFLVRCQYKKPRNNMLKKLCVFTIIAVQGIIFSFVFSNNSQSLHAGGVDVPVTKTNLYTTLYDNSLGDHVIRLDVTGTYPILHRYKISQNGNIEYAGFRNIVFDYAMANSNFTLKGGQGVQLSPLNLLKNYLEYYKNKDGYKKWKKERLRSMVTENITDKDPDKKNKSEKDSDKKTISEKDQSKRDPYFFIIDYCLSNNFYNKIEPESIRMLTIDKNSVGQNQRLFIADHTNKIYLLYEINQTVGINLLSARRFTVDQSITDLEGGSDLLFIPGKNPWSTKDLTTLMSKMSKNRENGRNVIRYHE